MKTTKNRSSLLLKCFALSLVLSIVSCSKDSYDSLSGDNSAISKKVLADPLFEKLDKAFYEYKLNAIRYGGTDFVDPASDQKLKTDIANKKVISHGELVKRKEAIGYRNYETRSKVRLDYGLAKLALLKKYPELAQNKTDFNLFISKHSKYEISHETVKKLLSENESNRKYVKN